MINNGIINYQSNHYSEALTSFEGALKINSIIAKKDIDTLLVYNIALTAEKALFYDVAIQYYNNCIDLNYGGSKVYGYVANIEIKRGDTIQYLSYLKQGVESYPDNSKSLIITLIKYYLSINESDLALQYLIRASIRDYNNPVFYFAQGALYDKLQQYDDAIKLYKKTISIDSNYFDAYYNMGALYFNRGADMIKSANSIPPTEDERFNIAIDNSLKELEKSLPYLELAYKLNNKDESTLQILNDVYFRLRNYSMKHMEMYLKYNQLLKSL